MCMKRKPLGLAQVAREDEELCHNRVGPTVQTFPRNEKKKERKMCIRT